MPEINELGRFLRSRREQLTPADVGLPDTGRRRTPGLRREEVAALAGLSIDYLVRLEQGRDRNPSTAVVNALAGALLLGHDERKHLARLAACESAPSMCPLGSGTVDEPAPTVRSLIEHLDPTPAVVIGPWYQVLAHNGAWRRVAEPLGLLDGDEPNLARFTFLDPRAHDTYPAWADVADEQVATLREAAIPWREDARMAAVLDELMPVEEFSLRWRRHDVARQRRGTTVLVHPDAGRLTIAYEVLGLPDDGDLRLVAWLPADDTSAQALDRLAGASGRPASAHLRVV